MPGEHRGVGDILSDHRLAQTVAAHQDEIAGFNQKIQRQRAFDDVAFDLSGPGPIEVGHGLESLDAAEPKQVTEWHLKLDSLPGKAFVVRADSPEKAAKKLIGELRAE